MANSPYLTVRIPLTQKKLLQEVAWVHRVTVTDLVKEALELLENKYQVSVEQVKSKMEEV